MPANSIIVGYARTKMDENEFHKRVKSYIKTIGPEQDKKLKEFLVLKPPLEEGSDCRNCRLMSLDSMIKMKGSLHCVNISRNVKEIGRTGIGIAPLLMEADGKPLLYGFAPECFHTCCSRIEEECLS